MRKRKQQFELGKKKGRAREVVADKETRVETDNQFGPSPLLQLRDNREQLELKLAGLRVSVTVIDPLRDNNKG